MNKKIEFQGQFVQLPWPEWEGVEICPSGIKTSKGLISISQLERILWMINIHGAASARPYRGVELTR